MITIKIEVNETIAIETEIGTIHLAQQIINVGTQGHDFRTVLDITLANNIQYEDTHDARIRLSNIRRK